MSIRLYPFMFKSFDLKVQRHYVRNASTRIRDALLGTVNTVLEQSIKLLQGRPQESLLNAPTGVDPRKSLK